MPKTFTPSARAAFRAMASPAAGGAPWPLGPVLNLQKRFFSAISTWPGRPPRLRKSSRSSQSSMRSRPPPTAYFLSPVFSCITRMASLKTDSVA